jgi:hypothetical protein
MKRLDVLGHRYGRMVILADAPKRGANRMVLCRCDCGTEKVANLNGLRTGLVESCGCFHRERLKAQSLVHGDMRGRKPTAEYRAWAKMIARCENQNDPFFSHYGGRGISVCSEWRRDYSAFLAAMGRKPSATHSLDRIDPNGNYEPANCRWATTLEQGRNRRTTRRVEYRGRLLALGDAIEAAGLDPQSYRTVYNRMRYGRSFEEAAAELGAGPS